MGTLIEKLKKGSIPTHIEQLAKEERIDLDRVIDGIVTGRIVVPRNALRQLERVVGVGAGLRTKVNANIGTSEPCAGSDDELAKLDAAVRAGADAVMDLSTGGDINDLRRAILKRCPVPLGTVPLYQAAAIATERRGEAMNMHADDLFEAIECQAQEGVDFMTLHAGVNRRSVEAMRSEGRVTEIVSRGGALTLGWMLQNDSENPLFEQYDRLLEILRRYDVTLSLGDGMRPGCLADATDGAQIQELIMLGSLGRRAKDAGVQVMIEGPGHVPLDQIAANIQLEKQLCDGAPFYVLGPLVTDIAPGYDHITSAIGGAIAASAGADFLCYVTPSEHLGLPTLADVKDGVIASRIAAHAADIVKGVPGAADWDLEMARARKALDWEKQASLAIDPERAARVREDKLKEGDKVCTMCGDFCAMKIVSDYLGSERIGTC